MKKITSTANPLIKELATLKKKKGRLELGRFLVEGRHMAEEAAAAGILETLLVLEENNAFPDAEIIQVSPAVLSRLSLQTSGTDMIGVCSFPQLPLPPLHRALYLDDVQDPGNLGTLIRSALSFGMDAVFCSDGCADSCNPKVLQASQGAVFHIPVVRCDLAAAIQSAPFPVLASCLHQKSIPLQEVAVSGSYGLVVGNEGSGIRPDILSLCPILVHIEMDTFESLNAGVAGSILMYHLRYANEGRVL